MTFAAALSEHPIPSEAAGEVIGQVLEVLGDGPPPDLAVLFATGPMSGALEDTAASVRALVKPATLVGTTAVSVVGGAREVEETAAIALWVGRLPAPAQPIRLEAHQTDDGWSLGGLPAGAGDGPRTLLLIPDPFSFPADGLVEHFATTYPDLTVVGGLASAARGPGGNRLILDDRVFTGGAVGALLPPGATVTSVVSQGCRPVGDPWVVTKAERNVIYELGGQPAFERLLAVVEASTPEDRALLQRGLHLGVVIDEQRDQFTRGDFLIRNVLGADRDVGAIAVGDIVDVGATVQFQVRDAASADEDLRLLLAGRHAQGALVFTCNGRGQHLFGAPDHDARAVDAVVAGGATAGMFCAGELGPIGGRSFLHGFTASILLFDDGSATRPG